MAEKMKRRQYRTLDDDAKIEFVTALRKLGWKELAARETGVNIRTVYAHIQVDGEYYDEVFAEAIAEANVEFDKGLAETARQRAQDGWVEKTEYDEDGEVRSETRKWSDRLLIELLKRRDPGFRPDIKIAQTTNAKVDLSGTVELKHEMADMDDEELDALELLLKKRKAREANGEG